MHAIATYIFWATLILYVLTLVFVSYVGVYLTYVAIPVIVVTGLIMKFTKPKDMPESKLAIALSETGKATTVVLGEVNDFLSEFNATLDQWNRKQDLFMERSKPYKDKVRQLKIDKIEKDINLKYAKTNDERNECKKLVEDINRNIKEIEIKINEIEKQCEIEAARYKK